MKSIVVSLFAVVVFLITLPLLASAQEIKKGDQKTLVVSAGVDVENPDPARKSSDPFAADYYDVCGVKNGGTVTVEGIDGDLLLVRYSVTGPQYHPRDCLTGVLFFTTKKDFFMMTAVDSRIQAEKERKKVLLKRFADD